MVVIPVLDLSGQKAVRARGGKRSEYRPLEPVSSPEHLARWFAQHWGFRHLYVADLDAIEQGRRHWDLYRRLGQFTQQLWLDLGIRHAAEVRQAGEELAGADCSVFLILALETLQGPQELEALEPWPRGELVFSLDLKDGRPLGQERWPQNAARIVELVAKSGLEWVILLDLVDVGQGDGVSTLKLWQELKSQEPKLRWVLGGGVRGLEDLKHLEQQGVQAVLVASALHQGLLNPQQLRGRGWCG